MKPSLFVFAAWLLGCAPGLALDVIIDRVVIKKHPIPAPYFVFMSAKAGHAEKTFHEPKKTYGGVGGIEAGEIEIVPKLVLKNVQLNTWATFTIHIDSKEETVANFRALRKHTGRFQIIAGSQDDLFTPELFNTPFMYQIFWHTEGN